MKRSYNQGWSQNKGLYNRGTTVQTCLIMIYVDEHILKFYYGCPVLFVQLKKVDLFLNLPISVSLS